MGDLSTHWEIFQSTALPLLRSQLNIPYSLAVCFELGNWLRDVSQFRDPYALQLQKQTQYKDFAGYKREVAGKILDQLLGPNPLYDKDPDLVAGAWGEWFKAMMAAIGCYGFCTNVAGRTVGLAESDYQRLFEAHFTQYFPHEHLDFPPSGKRELMGDWDTTSQRSQGLDGPRRRILAYLDDYIDYVAAILLGAEQDLRRLFGPSQRRNQSWQEEAQTALVRLGKGSHALEDFYFHSNFVEIAFMQGIMDDKVPTLDLPSYYSANLVGSLNEHDKRILFRRLRSPRLDFNKSGESILSRTTSVGARHIFTGQFAASDLSHTLADAFEGLDTNPITKRTIEEAFKSTLFTTILQAELRQKLLKVDKNQKVPDEKAIEATAEKHYQEVRSGVLIQNAQNARWSTPLFVSYIKHANDVDQAAMVQSRGETSIGRVLLTLAAQVEAEAQNSGAVEQTMNQKPGDEDYLSSDNTNSAESVSTHSLMSKDSVRKAPLRKQTDALARYAVGTVLNKLLARSRLGANSPYVDWAELLRRLLCHPVQAPSNWATQFVAQSRPPAAAVFEPKETIKAGSVNQQAVQGGKTVSRLQQSYVNLYRAEAARWADMTK